MLLLVTYGATAQNLSQLNTITNSYGEQVEAAFNYASHIVSVTTDGRIIAHDYDGSNEVLLTTLGTLEITAAHLDGDILFVSRDLTSSSGADIVTKYELGITNGDVVIVQSLGDHNGLSNASDIAVLSDGKQVFAGDIAGIGESFRVYNAGGNTIAYDLAPTAGNEFGTITAISATELFGGALAVADSMHNEVRIFDNNCVELASFPLQHVFGVDFLASGKLVATTTCPSTIHVYHPILNNGVLTGFEEEFTFTDSNWDFVVGVSELPSGRLLVNDQGNEELIRYRDLNSNVSITSIGKLSDGNSYCMTWNSTGNATSFQVQRSFNGGAYVNIGSVVPATSANDYSKTIAVVGSTVEVVNYYRIVSTFANGTTGYSELIPFLRRDDSAYAGGIDTGLLEASFIHLE